MAVEKIPALAEEATKTAQETMKAAEGKTDEEIANRGSPRQAAKAALDAQISEVFKLEGDKLAMFTAAMDVYKDARGAVKRIIVLAKHKEEDKAPSGSERNRRKILQRRKLPGRSTDGPA